MAKKPRPSTFAERLAYARWVRQLTIADSPEEADKDLAARIAVSTGWLAKWKIREDAPPGHREITALAEAVGVPWKWLAGQEDGPPLPALWADWFATRRGKPVALDDVRYSIDPDELADFVKHARKLTDEEIQRARDVVARGARTPAAKRAPRHAKGNGG